MGKNDSNYRKDNKTRLRLNASRTKRKTFPLKRKDVDGDIGEIEQQVLSLDGGEKSRTVESKSHTYKQQLFRENLIPQFGGKIPESAFSKERLTLNSFNENGIYTLDGKHVEQRPITNNNKHFRCSTFKINLPPNSYILTPQGMKNYIGRTVNTNYLIRDPVHHNIMPMLIFKEFPTLPVLSLNLLSSGLKNRRQRDYMWNKISPDEILRKMPPYIHSFLHHDD